MKQTGRLCLILIIKLLLPLSCIASSDAQKPYASSSWTGIYLGGNVGAISNTFSMTDNNATSFYATIQQSSNPKFLGGLQIGYRHQVGEMLSGVFGLEFNADFSNANNTQQYGSPYALYELNAHNELKNTLLLELTGGIAIHRTLLFLAAGLSFADINANLTSLGGVPYFDAVNLNQQKLGMVLGAGLEYAYTQAISFRFKMDALMPTSNKAMDNLGNTFQGSEQAIQAVFGINYRFSSAKA